MSAVPRMAGAARPSRVRLPRAMWSVRQAWTAAPGTLLDLLRPLGWAGALGAVCLLGAALVWWTGVRGHATMAQDLRQDIRALREQSRKAPPPARLPDAAEQLRAFHAFFPERTQISAALGEFDRLAAQRQLVLASGDYKYSEEKNLRLGRYELRLPVRGSYTQVYSLIAAALNAMPALALDEIVIKRESRLAGEVEAQLRFSLYVRQD